MQIKRGEIYFADLGEPAGRWEKALRRPVLVVSINIFNHGRSVIVAIPGTKGDNVTKDYPTNVRVSPSQSGLPLETVFETLQIRAIDPRHMDERPSGRVDSATLNRIEQALRLAIGL